MSDTPRTDSQLHFVPNSQGGSHIVVRADFARTLERELNAERGAHGRAIAELEKLRRMEEHHKRFPVLDAKWLDPECHHGCKSLVFKHERDALKLKLVELDEKLHACKAAAENSAVSVHYREGGKFDSEAAAAVRALHKNFLTSQASCVLRMLEADEARDELLILKAADYEALTECADYGLLKLKLEAAKTALDFITRCKDPIESTGYIMQDKAREALAQLSGVSEENKSGPLNAGTEVNAPEPVEVHIRADRHLPPETRDALLKMIECAAKLSRETP